jgi:hypothetical protein
VHTAQILADILAAPPPTPTSPPTSPPVNTTDGTVVLNTEAILAVGAKTLAPLIIFTFAIWVMTKSKAGRVSAIATGSGIMIWGLILLAGAGGMLFIGDDLVHLFFGR